MRGSEEVVNTATTPNIVFTSTVQPRRGSRSAGRLRAFPPPSRWSAWTSWRLRCCSANRGVTSMLTSTCGLHGVACRFPPHTPAHAALGPSLVHGRRPGRTAAVGGRVRNTGLVDRCRAPGRPRRWPTRRLRCARCAGRKRCGPLLVWHSSPGSVSHLCGRLTPQSGASWNSERVRLHGKHAG
jgi:hypothetical protein